MDDRKWHILAAFLAGTGIVAKWLNLGPFAYLGCIVTGVAIFFWTGIRDLPRGPDDSE